MTKNDLEGAKCPVNELLERMHIILCRNITGFEKEVREMNGKCSEILKSTSKICCYNGREKQIAKGQYTCEISWGSNEITHSKKAEFVKNCNMNLENANYNGLKNGNFL